MIDPQKDQHCKDLYRELENYSRMFDWVDKWVKEKPNDIALIEYNTGELHVRRQTLNSEYA